MCYMGTHSTHIRKTFQRSTSLSLKIMEFEKPFKLFVYVYAP